MKNSANIGSDPQTREYTSTALYLSKLSARSLIRLSFYAAPCSTQ